MDEGFAVGDRDRVEANGTWLLLTYAGGPTIRIDVRELDRILVSDGRVVLALGEITPHLILTEKPDVIREVICKVSPYTRLSPIRDAEMYVRARTRLDGVRSDNLPHQDFLLVGEDVVRATTELIYVGELGFRIADVREFAEAGADLPLSVGELPAAIAMLAVGWELYREDVELLARRVAEYEQHIRRRDP